MITFRAMMVGGLLLGLAACSTAEPATRSASVDPLTLPSGSVPLASPDYDVTAIRIDVLRTLSVSEANVFFPITDLVWHGDPLGNRHD